MGLFPIMVNGSAKSAAAAAAAERSAGSVNVNLTDRLPTGFRTLLQRKRKPKLQELATFTQQLANLLNSGMPLAVALNSMTHLESKGIPTDVSKDLSRKSWKAAACRMPWPKIPAFFPTSTSTWSRPANKAARSWTSCGAWRRISTNLPRSRANSSPR